MSVSVVRLSPIFYARDGRALLPPMWDCHLVSAVGRQGCAVRRSRNLPIWAPPGTSGWSKDAMCIPRCKCWNVLLKRSG